MDTASLSTTAHVAPETARAYREHGHWRIDRDPQGKVDTRRLRDRLDS